MKAIRIGVASVITAAAAGALALGAGGSASGAPAPSSQVTGVDTACVLVVQYRVTERGNMTDRKGNQIVGSADPGDILNARWREDATRYGGYNVTKNRWGFILTSKLQPTGKSWCE